MTIELSTAEFGIMCAFLGGQIATIAGVVRSNISQGKRIGALEEWKRGVIAVEEYKTKRHAAPVMGVPIQED